MQNGPLLYKLQPLLSADNLHLLRFPKISSKAVTCSAHLSTVLMSAPRPGERQSKRNRGEEGMGGRAHGGLVCEIRTTEEEIILYCNKQYNIGRDARKPWPKAI